MRAKRLKLRLFLEGQEVPVISASSSCGVNQPAQASIQVIPTDDVFKFEARTLVHVFFFDLYPAPESMDALAATADGDMTSALQKALGKEYRLLFAGETVQMSFSRTPSGRQAVLQCLDFSGYWDVAKQYFATGTSSTAASKIASFIGSASMQFSEDSGTTPAQMLTNILTGKPSSVPQLDGLLGGVIRLLEIIGGVYKGKGERFSGLNDFFAAAELRLRMSQTLGVSGKDTTSRDLFAHKEFKSWLRSTLSRNRGPITFRQIIELVLGRLFHDYVSVLAPSMRAPYETVIEVATEGGKWKAPADVPPEIKARMDSLKKTLDAANSAGGLDTLKNRFREITYVPSSGTGPVASGNLSEDAGVERANAATERDAVRKKYPNLAKAVGFDKGVHETAYNNREYYASNGPSMETVGKFEEALKKYQSALSGSGGAGTAKKNVTVMQRLIMQVFKPNIYFCAPPRCNVLFPDIYTSFNYQRSYLEETTRLELQTAGEYNEDSETTSKKKYYAPNIELSEEGKGLKKLFSSTSAKNGARFLMPHEKFTGIVPSFQQMADITAFQKIDKSQGQRSKLEYQQRVANFMFFDMRFGPRQASISCPFNPYVVAGMPMAVIDRHVSDSIRSSLGIMPTQYLGVPQMISHSVSSSGNGTTSITMSHCRTHNERLEHLGGLIATFQEAVGNFSSLKTFDVTFSAGEIESVLTNNVGGQGLGVEELAYIASDPTRTTSVKLKNEILNLKGKTFDQIGTLGNVVNADLIYVDENGGIGTVTAEYKRTIFKQNQVDVPLDKALFPPWFSPIYSNINIGRDFYQEMYGIGSICDPVMFKNGRDTLSGEFLPDNIVAREANAMASQKLDSLRASLRSSLYTPDGKELSGPPIPDVASDFVGPPELGAEVQLGMTVEQAIDGLVKSYADLRESGYSFDEFYKDYSWRPVATLTQVLGSPDFDISKAGDRADTTGAVAQTAARAARSIFDKNLTLSEGLFNGEEGFHSRAFGPFDALEHLEHPEVSQPGDKGTPTKVDPDVDPRGDRYRRIQAYVSVLKSSQGLLG